MSEKLCPGGCGARQLPDGMGDSHPESCPWIKCVIASPFKTWNLRTSYADERWREYWMPKVGDWIHTLDSNATFKVARIDGQQLEGDSFSRAKNYCRPATPKEIELAQGAMDRREKGRANITRVVELTGVTTHTAACLIDSFEMVVGAKYLSRGGFIAEVLCRHPSPSPGYDFHVRFGSEKLKTALDEKGRLWGDHPRAHDLLCRIYEPPSAHHMASGTYFVAAGEKRRVRAGEWVLGYTSRVPKLADRGDDGYEYDILQQIHIQAAGPASATPEARHDPASRPAASDDDRAKLQRLYSALVGVKIGDHLVYGGKVFVAQHDLYASTLCRFACPDEIKKFQESEKAAAAAKAPVTQQDASSGKASTLVAPAAQLLPTWLDGDVQAYLLQVRTYCPDEYALALAWDAKFHPKDQGDKRDVAAASRDLAAYLRAELLRGYDTDDPKKCRAIRVERLMEISYRAGRIVANRYQKPFDLTDWIHRSM